MPDTVTRIIFELLFIWAITFVIGLLPDHRDNKKPSVQSALPVSKTLLFNTAMKVNAVISCCVTIGLAAYLYFQPNVWFSKFPVVHDYLWISVVFCTIAIITSLMWMRKSRYDNAITFVLDSIYCFFEDKMDSETARKSITFMCLVLSEYTSPNSIEQIAAFVGNDTTTISPERGRDIASLVLKLAAIPEMALSPEGISCLDGITNLVGTMTAAADR